MRNTHWSLGERPWKKIEDKIFLFICELIELEPFLIFLWGTGHSTGRHMNHCHFLLWNCIPNAMQQTITLKFQCEKFQLHVEKHNLKHNFSSPSYIQIYCLNDYFFVFGELLFFSIFDFIVIFMAQSGWQNTKLLYLKMTALNARINHTRNTYVFILCLDSAGSLKVCTGSWRTQYKYFCVIPNNFGDRFYHNYEGDFVSSLDNHLFILKTINQHLF